MQVLLPGRAHLTGLAYMCVPPLVSHALCMYIPAPPQQEIVKQGTEFGLGLRVTPLLHVGSGYLLLLEGMENCTLQCMCIRTGRSQNSIASRY